MRLHDPSLLFNKDGSSNTAFKGALVPIIHEREDLFERKCSICLETINEQTMPVSCKHIYCMECIYGWVKYSNVCPLCKVQIKQLQVFDALNPDKVSEILEVPEPK